MANIENFKQNYSYHLDYHFRYVVNGEQEKDFDYANIVADTLQNAKEELMKKFDRPNCRIFKIEMIRKTLIPTITRSDLFLLTSPTLQP